MKQKHFETHVREGRGCRSSRLHGRVAGAWLQTRRLSRRRATRATRCARSRAAFIWGTATASYQVEGAVKEDGRGPSIWDTFSHTPGKVVSNATGDVANDHYHLYKGDVQLMKALGAKAYRFSIAWPRVFPNGDGPPNPKGLDFYNRLVDELLANGIQPYATLYHWDLPQSLQDRFGGWEGRDTSKAFADYAGHVAAAPDRSCQAHLHDQRVRRFYRGWLPVGSSRARSETHRLRLNQTRHHAVLGHGLAVQAIRASREERHEGRSR